MSELGLGCVKTPRHARDGDRRSYSSKTALTVKRASELNSPNDPKNLILGEFQSFAFLHSQGQKPT
jgi:hypothetical protein